MNDADLQGYGVVNGEGVELVLTFGTGMGAALFSNGTLMPNVELGRHPFGDGRMYEEHVSDVELKAIGKEAWSEWVHRILCQLEAFLNYDKLYMGGGNIRYLIGELPTNAKTFELKDAMRGGHVLWHQQLALVRPRVG